MVKTYWVYPYLIYEEPNLEKSHIEVVKLQEVKGAIDEFEKIGRFYDYSSDGKEFVSMEVKMKNWNNLKKQLGV